MSIDQSLRRKNSLARSRNVLTRAERIKVLQDEDGLTEASKNWMAAGRKPYCLPKVRVLKIAKKAKKAKEEEAATTEGAAPVAEAKPAAKKGGK